ILTGLLRRFAIRTDFRQFWKYSPRLVSLARQGARPWVVAMLCEHLLSIGSILLTAGLCLGVAFWLFTGMLGVVSMWTMPVLARQRSPDPPRWPKLSIIIPACNEAASIEAAVTSRLAQDYPDFEVCVIDDRSTDGTGAIVDRLAEGDPRVRAVHITELPEGWLGKVHALHRGVSIATGEWLLLSDADVHF